MGLYDRSAATALRMLTKYGRDITLRQYSKIGGGDYDPSLGSAAPAGEDGTYDTTRKGLIADQPGSQIAIRFGTNYSKGSTEQQSEKWVYMDANGDAPAMQDHIIFGGVEYSIVDVQEVSPGGTPVLYLVVLRT